MHNLTLLKAQSNIKAIQKKFIFPKYRVLYFVLRKVRGFLWASSYRDQCSWTRSLAVFRSKSGVRRNGWTTSKRKDMERGRKLSFALLDKGRACSFSRVASATEYLPSRRPAVSGDTDGPSFSHHFAETSITRFLSRRKKNIRPMKNCEKALKVDTIIVRKYRYLWIEFSICYQFLSNG